MAIGAPDDPWPEASAQLGLILGSALLATILPFPIFGAWALSYLALWLVIQPGWRPLSPRLGLALLGGGVLVALGIQGEQWRTLPEQEGLEGVATVLGDRFRIEPKVAIAPPVVRDDLPQSYYVTAPGAETVSLELGAARIAGAQVGTSLFRVDYDPRRDGPPPEGPFAATLMIDGHAVTRELLGVRGGAHPRSLWAVADRLVGLSEETDELFIIGAAEVWRVDVGDGPVDLAITEDGRAIVSLRHEEALAVVDLEAHRVVATHHLVGPPGQLALRGDRLAVALADRIELHRLPGFELERAIALQRRPEHLDFGASADELLVTTREGHDLLRIRDRIDRMVFGRPVLAMAVDQGRVFVAVSDFLPEGGPGANHEIEDQVLTIDLEAFGVIARTPTAERDAIGVSAGAGPIDLVASGRGLLIAFAGTGEVSRLVDGHLRREATFVPGIGGVVELGEAMAVSVPWMGEIRIGDRWIALSDTDDLRRRGERGFYEATLSGVSCASCHPKADSDQALHDIGHGTPRPTLSVLGVARTAPFLRGASYPSLSSLDAFAHGVLGGYRGVRADRAEALASYVESLGRGGKRSPVSVAGFAAFCKAACNECHRPPAFTDLAQYPSSFLFPERKQTRELLDTPSLFGVGETAPYLYDGRAPTLESIFEDHDEGRRHGAYGRLDPAEQKALFEFLRGL